ncbi:MAG: SOS response-associated peptidase [Nakamurella sp.]
MCGRFVLAYSTEDLLSEFEVDHVVEAGPAPSWNVAPTQRVRIVIERYDGGSVSGGEIFCSHAPGGHIPSNENDASLGNTPVRLLRTARWGLVPHWAKDRSIGQKMINARSETVAVKPAFRAAAARRRCLVPANGYFEWMADSIDGKGGAGGGAGNGGKTPYYLHDPEDAVLAMAGLYEIWRDDSLPEDHPDHLLLTTTVITRAAPDALGHIHDRSPVVVPRDLREDWLNCGPTQSNGGSKAGAGGEGDAPGAAELLAAIPPPTLVPREVGKAVGNVRNNSPSLIEPAPAGVNGLF